MKNKIIKILPVLGCAFLIIYLFNATVNIAYSDYIRIINEYLPDYTDIRQFSRLDLLTRTPATFIFRAINCYFFSLNMYFDMSLSILGIFITSKLIINYMKKYGMSISYYVIIAIICFSLNKWEMLTNATGFIHFLAIAAFIYYFKELDRELVSGETNFSKKLYILPMLITCTIAGDYGVPFLFTLIFTALFLLKNRGFNSYIIYLLIIYIFSLALYSISRSFAVYNITGTTELSLIEILSIDPLFIFKFIINSLASTLVNKELLNKINGQYFMGLLMLIILIYSIVSYFTTKLYRKSWFPIFLISYAAFGYLMVFVARWIFFNETYGMSSRYQLIYQFGVIGCILIIAHNNQICKKYMKKLNSIILMVLLISNILVTLNEWHMAKWRKEYGEELVAMSQNLDSYDDLYLEEKFQYGSAIKIKRAYEILYDNKWNVYSRR